MAETDLIIKKMSELYIMFCWPKIILPYFGNKAEIVYQWSDNNAKRLYDEYQKLLQAVVTNNQKKKYAELGLQCLTESKD